MADVKPIGVLGDGFKQVGTATDPVEIAVMKAPAGDNILAILSDSAGASFFTVQDSGGVPQLQLDSDGYLFLRQALAMPELATDAAVSANQGVLYMKDVSTETHLFFRNTTGIYDLSAALSPTLENVYDNSATPATIDIDTNKPIRLKDGTAASGPALALDDDFELILGNWAASPTDNYFKAYRDGATGNLLFQQINTVTDLNGDSIGFYPGNGTTVTAAGAGKAGGGFDFIAGAGSAADNSGGPVAEGNGGSIVFVSGDGATQTSSPGLDGGAAGGFSITGGAGGGTITAGQTGGAGATLGFTAGQGGTGGPGNGGSGGAITFITGTPGANISGAGNGGNAGSFTVSCAAGGASTAGNGGQGGGASINCGAGGVGPGISGGGGGFSVTAGTGGFSTTGTPGLGGGISLNAAPGGGTTSGPSGAAGGPLVFGAGAGGAGAGAVPGGNAGSITISGALGGGTLSGVAGNGSSVTISSGAGGSALLGTAGSAGNISLTAANSGAGVTAANGGSIVLTAGTSANTALNGQIRLRSQTYLKENETLYFGDFAGTPMGKISSNTTNDEVVLEANTQTASLATNAFPLTSNDSITRGDAVYAANNAGTANVLRAQANAVATSRVIGIALNTASATQTCRIAGPGSLVKVNTALNTASEIGQPVYLDPATAGGLTMTAPTTSGDTKIRIGYLIKVGVAGAAMIQVNIGDPTLL